MVATNPLIDLPHLRQLQLAMELGLTDEDDLQPARGANSVGEDAGLLDQRQRQVLRFVDDHHDEGLGASESRNSESR